MPSTTNLRKVGGSIMLAIPPAILDVMGLAAGTELSLEIDGDRLIIHKPSKVQYQLEDLIAECNFDSPPSSDDDLWLSGTSVGREIL